MSREIETGSQENWGDGGGWGLVAGLKSGRRTENKEAIGGEAEISW